MASCIERTCLRASSYWNVNISHQTLSCAFQSLGSIWSKCVSSLNSVKNLFFNLHMVKSYVTKSYEWNCRTKHLHFNRLKSFAISKLNGLPYLMLVDWSGQFVANIALGISNRIKCNWLESARTCCGLFNNSVVIRKVQDKSKETSSKCHHHRNGLIYWTLNRIDLNAGISDEQKWIWKILAWW